MDVNWDAAKFWLDVLQWLFTIGIGVAVWIRTGRNQNRTDIQALDDRQDALERRVISAEENLKHAPTHEDIAKLQSQSSALDSKLDRVTNTVDRIHDYLMNNKG
jgi:uncharacterized protein (DUF3084 family)